VIYVLYLKLQYSKGYYEREILEAVNYTFYFRDCVLLYMKVEFAMGPEPSKKALCP
jgi:hypothetical protein